MHPAFLDSMSWAMAEVYGSVTDQILVNIASFLPFLKNGAKLPDEFDYQARMLAQMGQVRKETIDIIMRGLSGADETLRKALEDAILDALEREEPALLEAAKKGLTGGMPTVEVSPGQMQAFQAYYKQSCDKLNLVNTVMLESTEAAYRATVSDVTQQIGRTQSILNTAAGETISGVSSVNTALRHAVKKMVDNGLTGFVDHAGRHWSPETYVAMDIRSTVFNTARAAVWPSATAAPALASVSGWACSTAPGTPSAPTSPPSSTRRSALPAASAWRTAPPTP